MKYHFDSLFVLMADTDNDENKLLTLLDIKENLKDYSYSKIKSLTSVLMNFLIDLAKDKEILNKALEKYEEEVVDISMEVAKLTNEKAKLKKDL